MKVRIVTSILMLVALLGIGSAAEAQQQRAYRGTSQAMRQLIMRIESRTDEFRNNLQRTMNRRYSSTPDARNEDPFQLVNDFSESVRQLHQRFDARQSTSADAQDVVNRAATVDDYLRRHAVDATTQNSWSAMRVDLNQLAGNYSISWPQSTRNYPGGGNSGYGNRFGNRLTGTYRLDTSQSDNTGEVANRSTQQFPQNDRQQSRDSLNRRLEAPEQIAISVNGRTVMIASSKASQITFEADGVERTETRPNGRVVRSRAVISSGELTVSSTGDRGNDFSVTFAPIDNGQHLRVTRTVYAQGLARPVIVQSTYDKISDIAQFDIYNQSPYPTTNPNGDFIIRNGDIVVGTLDDSLSTKTSQVGDRFTLRVRQPGEFEGATVEGHVANVQRSGRLTGRSVMTLEFDNIRLRDGRSYRFAGQLESVRTPGGDVVKVDTEGTVKDDNQTSKTVQRAAIGTAVGAIIGAIAGGGKGAAIGAVVGAGGGAGSVYVQGRDDLDLPRGTELSVRAGAPANLGAR